MRGEINRFYDTNALLDNYEELENESFIYISSVTLKELEDIKVSSKKDQEVKFKARRVTRFLSRNSHKYECIVVRKDHYSLLEYMQLEVNNDNLIMATAYLLNKEVNKDREKLIVYSNDLCFKNIGKNIFHLDVREKRKRRDTYTGYKEIVLSSDGEMANFYENMNNNTYNLLTNEYLIIRDKNNEVVDIEKWDGYKLVGVKVNKYMNSSYLGEIKPKDIYQMLTLESLQNNQMTLIKGKAGTGKSLMAMSFLLHQLEKGKINKIIIVTNPVKVKGSQDLGYYKGDKNAKLLSSQIGNFLISKLGSETAVEELIENEQLFMIPMCDIRGVDISGDSALYVTEAQNSNINLMQLTLQRVGNDSICIIDGDYNTQVDDSSFFGSNNGMRKASETFRGQDFYGEVELKEIRRSRIAQVAELMR